jgi:hypothetical protein
MAMILAGAKGLEDHLTVIWPSSWAFAGGTERDGLARDDRAGRPRPGGLMNMPGMVHTMFRAGWNEGLNAVTSALRQFLELAGQRRAPL